MIEKAGKLLATQKYSTYFEIILKNVQLYRNNQWKIITLLESILRQTWVTTLPCFLHQCTNPGRKRSLGSATHLLLEKKPVMGAAPFCSKSYVFPGGMHAPRIPAQPQQNNCPEYLSPWFRLSFYIQILYFLFCTTKPCQLNIQEFTFRLYKQFLIHNVFFFCVFAS